MSSGKPMIRQPAWLSLVPQLLFMAVLVALCSLAIHSFVMALEVAMMIYLAIFILLRTAIPHHHRKGISLLKTNHYLQAIEEFEKSYTFFTRHAWIDRWRYITLLSSSKISYTEMALLNIAFCYSQIDDGSKAKEYYEKTLKQFPKSEIAKTSLRMMSSAVNRHA